MTRAVHTAFPDHDALLDDHVRSVQRILGDDFVGAYLQGSFALGAGDANSDADFVVVTRTPPGDDHEVRLRSVRGLGTA